MPLLDSNLWAGTDPRMQQGMGGMQGQVPQLPPTLAAQLAQRAQMRMNPQMNPLLASTMKPPAQSGMEMMPPFQPTALPKPKEFWEQQHQPSEGMRSMSMANALPREAGVSMPGQLPQAGMPQIPNNAQGMGLGANAPQMMGGATPISGPQRAMMNQAQSMGMPFGNNEQGQGDPMSNLKNQMFSSYLNLYPEGNL